MRKLSIAWTVKFGLSVVAILATIQALETKSLSAATPNSSTAIADLPNSADGKIYQRLIQHGIKQNLAQAAMGTVVQTIAQQLLNAEYKAGLLDQSTQENLVISLRQFDCLLFIENVLAIAKNIKNQDHSYQSFTAEVENQRYWNGNINGYCSRLHYFSDWIADNQRRGNISNITKKLGGIDVAKKLDFMTTHRTSYKNLAKNEANFKCINRVEQSLSATFNYIPTKNISNIYPQLQPGDVVGVATDIPGLDFTHTGFVYRQPNGSLGLIHASPAGKVVIASDLQNYVGNVKNAIGIVVSRAN